MLLILLFIISFIDYQQQFAEYLGYQMWEDLKQLKGRTFTMEDIIKGMQKAENGETISIDSSKAKEIFGDICNLHFEKETEEKLKKANTYLENLKKNEHIIFLENGKIAFEVVQKGNDKRLQMDGLFHLKGSYMDGSIFLNTDQTPVYQSIDQAMLGFQIGTQEMTEGEKRILYIHPDLNSQHSLLIFEVELIRAF